MSTTRLLDILNSDFFLFELATVIPDIPLSVPIRADVFISDLRLTLRSDLFELINLDLNSWEYFSPIIETLIVMYYIPYLTFAERKSANSLLVNKEKIDICIGGHV